MEFPVVDFYVTCATVLAVLFLAVAVEGKTWESLVAPRPMGQVVSFGYVGRAVARLNFAYLILWAGIAGELFALFALFRGAEFLGQRAVVFGATMFLVIAVVDVPIRAWRKLQREAADEQLAEQTQGDGARPGPG